MKKPGVAVVVLLLALAGCGGGGGGSSPSMNGGDVDRTPIPPPGGSGGDTANRTTTTVLTGLRFRYRLEPAGGSGSMEDAVTETETGSRTVRCPSGGCSAPDLRDLSGTSGTGTRGGFGTVEGPVGTGGTAPVTETSSGVSVTVAGESFTRWGFWAEHGHAALEIGRGDLSARSGGASWTGTFRTAFARVAGEASGTNPAGTGSATWRGIAEAADTGTFERLRGTATLTVEDLSRPRVDAAVALEGRDPLEWPGMRPRGGAFSSGTAGADRIEGRFHGPGHGEAWGVFDATGLVGAFGARREP